MPSYSVLLIAVQLSASRLQCAEHPPAAGSASPAAGPTALPAARGERGENARLFTTSNAFRVRFSVSYAKHAPSGDCPDATQNAPSARRFPGHRKAKANGARRSPPCSPGGNKEPLCAPPSRPLRLCNPPLRHLTANFAPLRLQTPLRPGLPTAPARTASSSHPTAAPGAAGRAGSGGVAGTGGEGGGEGGEQGCCGDRRCRGDRRERRAKAPLLKIGCARPHGGEARPSGPAPGEGARPSPAAPRRRCGAEWSARLPPPPPLRPRPRHAVPAP